MASSCSEKRWLVAFCTRKSTRLGSAQINGETMATVTSKIPSKLCFLAEYVLYSMQKVMVMHRRTCLTGGGPTGNIK